jgi:hypothetical protein
MWSVYTIIGYFLLALAIPIAWMTISVRLKTRGARRVTCPQDGRVALVELDSWHAVKMHALGNPELLVRECQRWPASRGCDQECREQMATRG